MEERIVHTTSIVPFTYELGDCTDAAKLRTTDFLSASSR